MKKDANFGMLTTFVGGTLWGINGVMGSFLFLYKNITTNWLIPYRLVFAGLLLLGYLYYKQGSKIFDILKNPKDLLQILLFGFIGMLGTQYTYFSAIQYSNAAIATVLTYFGPTLVLIFMCLKERRKPLKYEIVSILLSSFGVFLLATHGDVTNLQISFKALVWGLLSALSVVIYTVQPEKLLKKYGPSIVVAWGMIIGGILITFVTKPWNIDVIFDFTAFFVFLLIVFFGTIVAFILYLTGVNIIGPTKASIIACIEPVAATICAILFTALVVLKKFKPVDVLVLYPTISFVMLVITYLVRTPSITLIAGFVIGYAGAGGVLQLAVSTANELFPTNKGKITSIVMIASSLANYVILEIAGYITKVSSSNGPVNIVLFNAGITLFGVLLALYVRKQFKLKVSNV